MHVYVHTYVHMYIQNVFMIVIITVKVVNFNCRRRKLPYYIMVILIMTLQ